MGWDVKCFTLILWVTEKNCKTVFGNRGNEGTEGTEGGIRVECIPRFGFSPLSYSRGFIRGRVGGEAWFRH